MSADYVETYELPSRALLYEDEDMVEEIDLRAMKTKEEKMLLGSTGKNAFDMVLGKCIVKPKNYPIGKLIMPDYHFLVMKLRILSYGSIYHAKYKCQNPSCGETYEYKINLDELPVYNLDEDFEEPFKIELPVSGDTVGLRLLRNKDNKKIKKKAKRIKKKTQGRAGNMEYIYRLAERLVEINDEPVDVNKRKSYIENLHTRDTGYMKNKLGEIEVGYDLNIFEECPYCGADVEFTLPLNEEFFRSRFED